MKAFIEYVVKALVDFPDEVDVREVNSERSVVYELRLNKTDIGKVIGKQGRTIQSLRTLVNSASAKQGRRSMVEIIEDIPPGQQPGAPTPESATTTGDSTPAQNPTPPPTPDTPPAQS